MEISRCGQFYPINDSSDDDQWGQLDLKEFWHELLQK